MGAIMIGNKDLESKLKLSIRNRAPYNQNISIKKENIESFNNLSRKGLKYSNKEKRILLYTTTKGEKIYFQYPGMESVRKNNKFPNDGRPIIVKSDGEQLSDMAFKEIWDILYEIKDNQKKDLKYVASIFVRMAYMIDYKKFKDSVECETLCHDKIVKKETIDFCWNKLYFDTDVIEKLNDMFDKTGDISFEAYLYYNDLLMQNEDCKYNYLKKDKWDFKVGRVNTSLTHLKVISFLLGETNLSNLLNVFSKRKGVAPVKLSEIETITDKLVKLDSKK